MQRSCCCFYAGSKSFPRSLSSPFTLISSISLNGRKTKWQRRTMKSNPSSQPVNCQKKKKVNHRRSKRLYITSYLTCLAYSNISWSSIKQLMGWIPSFFAQHQRESVLQPAVLVKSWCKLFRERRSVFGSVTEVIGTGTASFHLPHHVTVQCVCCLHWLFILYVE